MLGLTPGCFYVSPEVPRLKRAIWYNPSMAGYPEKIQRNKKLYEDKKSMSWKDLMIKYDMSYSTIYRILKREEKRAGENSSS